LRHLILLLVMTIAVTGCGASSATATSTSTHVAMSSYTDSQFGFSFHYPSTWKISKQGGQTSNVAGVQTYILDIAVPHNSAQVSVTVDGDVTPFPAFSNGHTAPDPNGPTHTFQYFHAHVAGWPAMVIHRFSGKQISEMDTVTNTRTRSYDVRMLTATPPFSSDVTVGYNQVVKTFKVPFA
jgi:hypothetical protein